MSNRGWYREWNDCRDWGVYRRARSRMSRCSRANKAHRAAVWSARKRVRVFHLWDALVHQCSHASGGIAECCVDSRAGAGRWSIIDAVAKTKGAQWSWSYEWAGKVMRRARDRSADECATAAEISGGDSRWWCGAWSRCCDHATNWNYSGSWLAVTLFRSG